MERREQLAWLTRRVCLGQFSPAVQEAIVAARADNDIARFLTQPGPSGDPVANPWQGTEEFDGTQRIPEFLNNSIRLWLDHMHTGPRPVEEWMTFFWHDHFAVSGAVVRPPDLMLGHINTLRRFALGNFREMLRAVTIDPAMLRFLNGADSTGDDPNENYGRELLELYALGIGNYTEADVRAASVALTGWVVTRDTNEAQFIPRRHATAPQTLLDAGGVSTVDDVIAAVTAHPACAHFVAGKLARAILGEIAPEQIDTFAEIFRLANLEIRPLVMAIINAGLAGAGSPIISAPIPWLTLCRSALGGVALGDRGIVRGLRSMGQIPLRPPNVGGFPAGRTYLGASAIAGRFQAATALATGTGRANPCLRAAAAQDWESLADLLYRPTPFGAATRAALEQVSTRDANGRARAGTAALGLALTSPEMMTA